MKIALAQLNYQIGNFELNTQKIIDSILQARAEGADLVVHPVIFWSLRSLLIFVSSLRKRSQTSAAALHV
jgi:hypothetical protein